MYNGERLPGGVTRVGMRERVEGYLSSVEQAKVEMEAATKLNLGSGLCLDSSLVV